jgi:hypothetical protein
MPATDRPTTHAATDLPTAPTSAFLATASGEPLRGPAPRQAEEPVGSDALPRPIGRHSQADAPHAAEAPQPVQEPVRVKSLSAKWLSRNLTIRVLAYTAGAHVFAGFIYLLFAIGAHQGR